MSKKDQRLNNLISIIKINNGASIKELSTKLDVSEMTIRRDIKILESQNILEIYHGSVVYNPNYDNPTISKKNTDYSLSSNSVLMEKEKTLIGKKAAELVENDDIIIIDSGTTTEKLSSNLNEDINFTCLVFSSNNLIHLLYNKSINLIFAGGKMHRESGFFESPEGLKLIEGIRASKVFLSAAGVHKDLGLTCANSYEIEAKKTIIKNSVEVILLVDSSKFDQVKSAYFCDLDQVDTIITDRGINDEWKKIIKDKNIKLIIA
ncbi:MAG: DeoR/GlpR family DNA-binding transcription regulator [Peptoniphilaceae bacterium]|nr:DeoR/GlpR family DNA-binding transcription regulator [Peptoniphilaceae bacterium]MDY6019208.1 DeoR/GlpR family DNA-binding transcription regulator [Anaerococcus sp.]